MSKPQVYRMQVQLPGYKYLWLLACVDSWTGFRDLVAAAGHPPPAGKPKDLGVVPREERELAEQHPGVLLTKDMDAESADWEPAPTRGG